MRSPLKVRIWPTPVYYPTGRYATHCVVTTPILRDGILRTESKEIVNLTDARAFAQSEGKRLGLEVAEEGIL